MTSGEPVGDPVEARLAGIGRILTAEEFLDVRNERSDGSRCELWMGRLVVLSPADEDHGLAVMNLTRALGDHLRRNPTGYAAFAHPIVVARDPDTVRCPAIACFGGGPTFAALDADLCEIRPDLVVEMASTNDRRRGIGDRVRQWLEWGVPTVWVLDPSRREANVVTAKEGAVKYREGESLHGTRSLAGFQIGVSTVFAVPEGWR
jgi:Uma2 family endonuclease